MLETVGHRSPPTAVATASAWVKVDCATYLRGDGSIIEKTAQGWVGRHANGAPPFKWPVLWAAKESLDCTAEAWAVATARA